MIRLDNAIDKVIFDMTVKAMLDPKNEYFYLPNLTLAKCEELCDNDDDKTEMFWLCYNYAFNKIFEDSINDENNLPVENFEMPCPECGCKTYVLGCSCPNCDYNE